MTQLLSRGLPRASSTFLRSVSRSQQTTSASLLSSSQRFLSSTCPRPSSDATLSQAGTGVAPFDPKTNSHTFKPDLVYRHKDLHPPAKKSIEQHAADGAPFVVRRTPSAQLPIYRRGTRQPKRVSVQIKKIEGDKMRMLDELVEALGMERANARINPYTGFIELKGDHYKGVRSWLLQKGF